MYVDAGQMRGDGIENLECSGPFAAVVVAIDDANGNPQLLRKNVCEGGCEARVGAAADGGHDRTSSSA